MRYSGILGSGFGLYGHLPALVHCTHEMILLPERYRTKFDGRQELQRFASRIVWRESELELISESRLLIVAQMPRRQEEIMEQVLQQKNNRYVLLEKPLARTPELAADLLRRLSQSGKVFRVMYSFLYLSWFKQVKELLMHYPGCKLEINWKFKAHHFVHGLDTWKRFHSKGGGVLRFYGIHLLAVIAGLGAFEAKASAFDVKGTDEPFAWKASFEECSGHRLQVDVDSDAPDTLFSIRLRNEDKLLMQLDERDPFFECSSHEGLDSRVNLNETIIRSWLADDDSAWFANVYEATNVLWKQTEAQTI